MNEQINPAFHSDSVAYLEGLSQVLQKQSEHLPLSSHAKNTQIDAIQFGRSGIAEFGPKLSEDSASSINHILRTQVSQDAIQNAFRSLISVEYFENFLHTKYVGQKRFSIEGCDSAIVFLESLINKAQADHAQEVILGMSHRGRLNALYHVLHKPLEKILMEFEGIEEAAKGSGDVKYHKGFTRIIYKPNGILTIRLVDNPSHLESVFPVVEGEARGYLDSGIPHAHVLPIVFHGDASFAGQGVVYETFQLHRLSAYTVQGTIHLIVNNKIGFTATPEEFMSMKSCTDVAHAFNIPVFHVEADDLEGVLLASRAAYWIRQNLKSDVIIDLIGNRRWGHNESDEPAFTSPVLYDDIRKQSRFRKRVSVSLVEQGLIAPGFLEAEEKRLEEKFSATYEKIHSRTSAQKYEISSRIEEHSLLVKSHDTVIQEEMLKSIIRDLLSVPEHFSSHHGLQRQIEQRRHKFEELGLNFSVDWAFAESIALSSLCRQVIPVRLIGQDTPRGTFSQRHAVWFDQQGENSYYPIRNGLKDPNLFQVWNSSLSENAALAFEYGYSLARPDSFVAWEAQFGDFVNGAQVVIDQYLSSSEQKWGSPSHLVLLLPHGYEGQGPEHSSSRLERFLQLSAQNNWVIAQPTTPLQYMMLIRRHMSESFPVKPLIVMTPKSLLRNPECVSKAIEATTTGFQTILHDGRSQAQTLILCSGKVYYDYQVQVFERFKDSVSFMRIEQLYPLPRAAIAQVMAQMTNLKKIIWLQEEPENMGANWYIHEQLEIPLISICRQASASPAVGIHRVHENEETIIRETLFSALENS